ncbi:MAG: SAM hydrolase/SAM-dependent halogenase family protein, partial [Salinispira sp.]
HVQEKIGIRELREIEESVNRLANSEHSYTFHGRDVYAYTGARLAAGVISMAEVGRELPVSEIISLPNEPARMAQNTINANIDILDTRYGSLWTNASRNLFGKLGISYGEYVYVEISQHGRVVYGNDLVYCRSFSDVNIGASLVYINSLLNVGIAINQGNFARAHNIHSGFKIQFSPSQRK